MLRKTFFTSLILLLALCLPCAVVFAQTAVTPEMLRAFQNLTPAQRAQALEMLQGGGASTGFGDEQRLGEETPFAGSDFGFGFLGDEAQTEPEELRIEGNDTIVVTTTLKEDAKPGDAQRLMADINRSRIIGSRVFKLDKRGVLELAGIASIPLAGLTAEEVAIRLGSEPLLAPVDITVTILPLTPVGTAALEPFGYSLFGEDLTTADGIESVLRKRSTFDAESLSYMPVPRDYVLGPGDSIHIQLYGSENNSLELVVQRDGTINFPRLGPRPVAGLTFGELREEIKQWVSKQLIGTEVSVSMGSRSAWANCVRFGSLSSVTSRYRAVIRSADWPA